MLQCALCKREVPAVTKHHLMPRSRSKKRKRRGQLEHVQNTRDASDEIAIDLIKGEARPAEDVTIGLCPPCHNMVHAVLTEKELERSYYTIDLLMSHDAIATFVKWVAKQRSDRKVSVRQSRGKR